jgi:hypothetical protein
MAFPRHSVPEQSQDQQQGRCGDRHAQPNQGEEGRSRTATPLKKNAAPQTTARAISMPDSRPPMYVAGAPFPPCAIPGSRDLSQAG